MAAGVDVLQELWPHFVLAHLHVAERRGDNWCTQSLSGKTSDMSPQPGVVCACWPRLAYRPAGHYRARKGYRLGRASRSASQRRSTRGRAWRQQRTSGRGYSRTPACRQSQSRSTGRRRRRHCGQAALLLLLLPPLSPLAALPMPLQAMPVQTLAAVPPWSRHRTHTDPLRTRCARPD